MKVKLHITEVNSEVEQAMADYIQDTIDAFMNTIKIIENCYCSCLEEIEEEEEK